MNTDYGGLRIGQNKEIQFVKSSVEHFQFTKALFDSFPRELQVSFVQTALEKQTPGERTPAGFFALKNEAEDIVKDYKKSQKIGILQKIGQGIEIGKQKIYNAGMPIAKGMDKLVYDTIPKALGSFFKMILPRKKEVEPLSSRDQAILKNLQEKQQAKEQGFGSVEEWRKHGPTW